MHRMHYVACKSHQIQKHKIGLTCPGVLFRKTAPGPPEYGK
jgi:hypothetical protein